MSWAGACGHMAESHVTIWKNQQLMQVWTLSEAKSTSGSLGKIWSQLDISDARPQLSFSTPFLPPEWWSSLLFCPSWSPPSVSSPQNGTAQLIQEDFLRSQTFWDRALRRGGRTFMFWHLPHQWTDRLAGWAKLFAFCRQFSLFHRFSPRCQLASLWTITKLQLRFVSSALLTTLFGSPTLRGHGFNCTLQRVYNPIFTFFREERGVHS